MARRDCPSRRLPRSNPPCRLRLCSPMQSRKRRGASPPVMSSIREPACIGCYSADPDELREELAALFAHPDASGLPGDVQPDGSLIAALVPHIDYARGGLTYTWGFKEIVERTSASLFVIVGT